MGSLFGKVSHLTNREVDKGETYNAFFAPFYNTDDGSWDT